MIGKIKTFKILLLGNHNTGKTQFNKSISEMDVIVTPPAFDEKTTQLIRSVDFGKLGIDNDQVVIHFFGNGEIFPLSKYPPLSGSLELLTVDGIVFLPKNRAGDAAYQFEADNLAEEKNEFNLIQQRGIPYLIVANRQDQENTFSPDQIRRRLDIPESTPIYPCVATDKTIVQRIVLELFKAMPPSDDVQTVIDFLSTPEVLGVDFDSVGKDKA